MIRRRTGLRAQVQVMADTLDRLCRRLEVETARAYEARRQIIGVERPQLRVIVGDGHATPGRAALRVLPGGAR